MGKRINDKNGIYLITNLLDKKIYVGESGGIYKRWSDHRNYLRRGVHHNIHLQRAWTLLGEDMFKFEVIEVMENATRAERLIREEYYCNLHNSYNEEFGYNFKNNDYQNSNKRKVPTPKKAPKKVYQLSTEDGHLVSIWSKREIGEYFRIPIKQVEKMIFGTWRGIGDTVKTSRGYIWVLEGKYSPEIDYVELCQPKPRELKPKLLKEPRICKPKHTFETKPISLQNIETGEIKTFPSHIEAAKELNINKINFYYLNRGFRMKRDKKVNISQWKGWRIYKPTTLLLPKLALNV